MLGGDGSPGGAACPRWASAADAPGKDAALTAPPRRQSPGGIPGAAGAAGLPRSHLCLLAGCHGGVPPQPLAVRGAALPLDRALRPLSQGAPGLLPQVGMAEPRESAPHTLPAPSGSAFHQRPHPKLSLAAAAAPVKPWGFSFLPRDLAPDNSGLGFQGPGQSCAIL